VASRRNAGGLGIDAERLRPLEDALVRRICSPDEVKALEEIPGFDRSSGALAIFSAKESTYKCYYPVVGKVLEYADLEVRLHPDSGEFEAALARDALPSAGGARSFTGRFTVDAHYVYTTVMLTGEVAPQRNTRGPRTDPRP
jgi:4'-phosphopantetheinyl transferase EntD